MAICNKYKNCNAFVYDTTVPSPVCYQKNIPNSDVYSIKNLKSGAGKTMYIRDKKPIKNPTGIDNSVNNVDSITYQNYGNKGGELQNSYLLSTVNSVQKQELSQLRDNLKLLSSQVNNKIERLNENNINMINDIKLEFIKEVEWVEGIEGFEGINADVYLKTMNQTNDKIKKMQTNNIEIDSILRDTNIKTLQQNYNYMLWSILAIGATIVAIKVKNT
jgi:hypothetical protein